MAKKKPKVTIVIREEVHYKNDFDQNMVKDLVDQLPKNSGALKKTIKTAVKTLIGDSQFTTNPPPHYGVDQEIDPD